MVKSLYPCSLPSIDSADCVDGPGPLENQAVPLRWQEVALPLFMITLLVALKHIPFTDHLPLARAAGVVAFGYAAFLALRLVQPEEGIMVEGGAFGCRVKLADVVDALATFRPVISH